MDKAYANGSPCRVGRACAVVFCLLLAGWLLRPDGAHAASRQESTPPELAFEFFTRQALPDGLVPSRADQSHLVSTKAAGYRLMALCVGVERGWLERKQAAEKALATLETMRTLPRHHGFWASAYDAETREAIPPGMAETRPTAILCAGALVARQFFAETSCAVETGLRREATTLYREVQWPHMVRDNSLQTATVMAAQWSSARGFLDDLHPLEPYDDLGIGMLAWLLAIASPSHGVPASLWYEAWAAAYQLREDTQASLVDTASPVAFLEAFLWLDLQHRKDRAVDYHASAVVAQREAGLDDHAIKQEPWKLLDPIDKPVTARQHGLTLGLDANRENALVSRLFHASPDIAGALDRIGLLPVVADFTPGPPHVPHALLEPVLHADVSLAKESAVAGRYALGIRHGPRMADAPRHTTLHLYPALRDFSVGRYIALRHQGEAEPRLRVTDHYGKAKELGPVIKGPDAGYGWRALYYPLGVGEAAVDISRVQRVDWIIETPRGSRQENGLAELRLVNEAPLKPPAVPGDFTATPGRLPGEVLLRWRQSGPVAQPHAYHLRYSHTPIRDAEAFASAKHIPGLTPRGLAGSALHYHAVGLPAGRPLHFALRAESLQGYVSPLAVAEPIQLAHTSPPAEVTIDNFDQRPPRLVWRTSGPHVHVERNPGVSIEGAASLEVSYRIGGDPDHHTAISAEMDLRDISRYDYVTCWIAGRTEVTFRLIDTQGRYQDAPPVSVDSLDAWAPVFVDVSRFDAVDRRSIQRIALLIEPGQTHLEGAFFLDALGLSVTRN